MCDNFAGMICTLFREPPRQTLTDEDIDQLPSRHFKGFDCSNHYNVQKLIGALYLKYEAWYRREHPNGRLRDAKNVKQHLTHFVLEAYRTHRACPGMSLGVHLGNDYYNREGDRYHPSHLSYRIVKNVTTFLVETDYLEKLSEGIWHTDPAKRRTTRFRATDCLIALCEEHGINPYMIKHYGGPEIIILRAERKGKRQGDLRDYKDTPFTMRARADLERINEFIARHNINLDITDEQEEALRHRIRNREEEGKDKFLDFTKTRLSRHFNNGSFEQGGRFYGGWWQQIAGEYRHFITIDGEPTIELDYSEMHFAIMYAKIGMEIPMEDAYVLEGYDTELRSHIKKAFNIIINCTSRKQAIKTINSRIRDGELSAELGDGETLLEAFEKKHPLIKDKIASGEGVRGMFMESQVAEYVLLKGMEIGLCILPIHDGFIMVKQHADDLEGLMDEAMMEVIGHSTYIKPELRDLSSIPHVREYIKHLNSRSESDTKSNGTRLGDALSSTPGYTNMQAQGDSDMNTTFSKKNKERRDREWKQARNGIEKLIFSDCR